MVRKSWWNKKKRGEKRVSGLILFILLTLTFNFTYSEESCELATLTKSEDFSDTLYREPSSSVEHWGEGYISLSRVGGVFAFSNPDTFPSWVTSVTSGDFDNDGWVDFIGTSTRYDDIAFLKNEGVNGKVGSFVIDHYVYGSNSDNKGNPDHELWPPYPVALTRGDYDGDSDLDIFLLRAYDEGTICQIWLFLNDGSGNFTRYDYTSKYESTIDRFHYLSNAMYSLDLDGYNGVDIIIGTGNRSGYDGKVLFYQNDGTANFTVREIVSSGWRGQGVNTVVLSDFDRDGDQDLIIGSVSYPGLKYYKNDGYGNFSYFKPIGDTASSYSKHNFSDNEYDGGATALLASDFDGDGDQDLIIGTDNWRWGSSYKIGGKIFFYKNDGAGNLSGFLIFNRGCGTEIGCDAVYDFDLGDVIDYDNDGDIDFLMADGNQSKNYYLFENTKATVYNLKGEAISKSVDNLEEEDYSIVSFKVTSIPYTLSSGTSVKFYVSNNGGKDWEALTGEELAGEATHSFKEFGADLRFKIILEAENDQIPEYENASYETPTVYSFSFSYDYTSIREYSRTSPQVTFLDYDNDGEEEEILYAASFSFPGWEGYLRAYDVTSVALEETEELEDIEDLGASLIWEAQEILEENGNRNIYTTINNKLIKFNVTNKETLGNYLGVSAADLENFINWIRGEDREPLLLDINHSIPVIVGPTSGDTLLMGEEYKSFRETYKDRPTVVYVGANDGMLHVFDAKSGEEFWGFIPFNLLPKLKTMLKSDEEEFEYDYETHPEFVDGQITSGDIRFRDGNWHTILVVGQGRGRGGYDKNAYFALDVSDPYNPLSLWEFTDELLGETHSKATIGKVKLSGEDRFIVALGSGYDNDSDPYTDIGNTFFIIDAETGEKLKSFTFNDLVSTSIQNALPGSPQILDYNGDSYMDHIYIGDLEGRLYRIDVTESSLDKWQATVIYEDESDHPIRVSPTLYPLSNSVLVAIGTGGDESASDNDYYAFIVLEDNFTDVATIKWYLGPKSLEAKKWMGELEKGEKIWSDPVRDGDNLYFTSVFGSIEVVNPCENLSGSPSRFYARDFETGVTVLKDSYGVPVDYLETLHKVRSAVSLGGTIPPDKRKVYLENFVDPLDTADDPTKEVIAVSRETEAWQLVIRSWREIL